MYKNILQSIGPGVLVIAPINPLMVLNTVQGPQLDIYQVATKYEALHRKSGSLNYEQMKTTIGFVNAGQLGIQEPNKLDLETSLTIIKNDPINKRLHILYTINKIGFNEAAGIIIIYAKDAIKNQDLEDVEIVGEKFIKTQATKNKSFNPAAWKNGQEVSVSELGIVEPENNGTTISYKIKSVNTKTGQVFVQIEITKNMESTNVKLVVDDFKIDEVSENNEIDQVLDTIKDQTTEAKINPDWKIDDEITVEQLGIEGVDPLGTQVVYKIKNIDQENNQVIITVIVSKDDQSKTKDILISGFKTENEDQKDVDQIIMQITDQETTKNDLVPMWATGQIVTEEELGIPKVAKAETAVEFKVKEISDEDKKNGNLPITVTVTKNDAKAEKDIVISGYKKDTSKQDAEDVNKIVNEIKQNLTTKFQDFLPSDISKNLPLTSQILGIEVVSDEILNGATINYQLITSNDQEGKIEVKAIISKGQAKQEVKINISGYLTLKEFLNQEIDKIDGKSFKTNQANGKVLSIKNLINLIGQTVGLKDLGIDIPLPKGVEAKIKIDPVSRATAIITGELKAFITLVKDGVESKEGKIICQGYSLGIL